AKDPLEVLRWTARNMPGLVPEIENALRVAELVAVSGATPTPYSLEVMMAAKEARLSTAIVSNNSAPAIESYIIAHHLDEYISFVVGREPYHPDRMKPAPYAVEMAVKEFKIQPLNALLVGDSTTDVIASHSAGVRVIALANKPGKREQFRAAGADAVVTSMIDVSFAITNRVRDI